MVGVAAFAVPPATLPESWADRLFRLRYFFDLKRPAYPHSRYSPAFHAFEAWNAERAQHPELQDVIGIVSRYTTPAAWGRKSYYPKWGDWYYVDSQLQLWELENVFTPGTYTTKVVLNGPWSLKRAKLWNVVEASVRKKLQAILAQQQKTMHILMEMDADTPLDEKAREGDELLQQALRQPLWESLLSDQRYHSVVQQWWLNSVPNLSRQKPTPIKSTEAAVVTWLQKIEKYAVALERHMPIGRFGAPPIEDCPWFTERYMQALELWPAGQQVPNHGMFAAQMAYHVLQDIGNLKRPKLYSAAARERWERLDPPVEEWRDWWRGMLDRYSTGENLGVLGSMLSAGDLNGIEPVTDLLDKTDEKLGRAMSELEAEIEKPATADTYKLRTWGDAVFDGGGPKLAEWWREEYCTWRGRGALIPFPEDEALVCGGRDAAQEES